MDRFSFYLKINTQNIAVVYLVIKCECLILFIERELHRFQVNLQIVGIYVLQFSAIFEI